MIAATNQAPERCAGLLHREYPVPGRRCPRRTRQEPAELEVPVDVVAEAVARP
jgi:hypothetical protein